MAVFLDDARRRNHSPGRVTVVGVLFVLFDYIAFFCRPGAWMGRAHPPQQSQRRRTDHCRSSCLAWRSGLPYSCTWAISLRQRPGKCPGLAGAPGQPPPASIHPSGLLERRTRPFLCRRRWPKGLTCIRGKRRNCFGHSFSLNSIALLLCVLAFTFLALGTPFTVGTLVAGLASATCS